MMRVLQQKLEPLEPETPMEVEPCLCFLSLTRRMMLKGEKKNNRFPFSALSPPQTESESGAASAAAKKNFIDQYFGVEFETTYPFLCFI